MFQRGNDPAVFMPVRGHDAVCSCAGGWVLLILGSVGSASLDAGKISPVFPIGVSMWQRHKSESENVRMLIKK